MDSPPLETTLYYSESLLRKALWYFWRRTIGVGFPVALGFLACCLVLLVVRGAPGWVLGAVSAVLALGIAMATALLVSHFRNSMNRFRSMGVPQATFRAEENAFTMSTTNSTSTLGWSTVKELWRFPDVWLLMFSKAQFVTLPLACLPPDLQDFIVERVRQAGGKIA